MAERQLATVYLLKDFGDSFSGPEFEVHVDFAFKNDGDDLIVDFYLGGFDALIVAAVEAIGEAENGNEPEDEFFDVGGEVLEEAMAGLGHGLAMEAAEEGDCEAFFVREGGQVTVGDEVEAVLVMGHVADVVAGVAEVSGGFEEFAGGSGELVERMECDEESVGEVGGLAGVFDVDAEAAGHGFDDLALFFSKAREIAAATAFSEIGDDAVADSGDGIEDFGLAVGAKNAMEDTDAGDDNFGALGADAGDLATGGESAFGEDVFEFADVGGGSVEAVGEVAIFPGDFVEDAENGGGSGGGGDDAIEGPAAGSF